MDKPDVYSILGEHLGGADMIPASFREYLNQPGPTAVYLVSCGYGERFLYISPSFTDLTGYQPEQFRTESLPFWFSRINPLDVPRITQQITEAHQQLFHSGCPDTIPEPLVLEYRFRRADDSWLWLEETKQIVSFTPEGNIDFILVCLRDISAQKKAEQAEIETADTPLLRIAAQYQAMVVDSPIQPDVKTPYPEPEVPLTRREKEVLRLLASGLSTKAIAHQLFISINTVETHRRHLLEKFQVHNSVELVRKASHLL